MSDRLFWACLLVAGGLVLLASVVHLVEAYRGY